MKIPITHKITNAILFEHECENNTIKTTLEIGVKENIHFRGAYLRDAYLEGASLGGAYLNVKIPPLNDHTFISEILWQQAKTENEKDFSSRIFRETLRCWKYFYEFAQQKQVFDWAEKILSQWEIYANKIEELKNEFTRIQHNKL